MCVFLVFIIRSTPLSRPNKVGFKSPSACSYVRLLSVLRPSAKSSFDFNEIWSVCTSRRVMHDGMQYDPIQGQGHEPLTVGNSAIFKGYLLPHL